MTYSHATLHKPQLDALRAFAVSAVLIHHFLPVARYIPEDFLTLGLLAVRLFFVLSGYLITGILLRSRHLPFGTAIKQFYIRRTLRIIPIFYITLFVLLIADVTPVRQYCLWHFMYLSNFLYWLNPFAMGSTGHLWTLSVEEQFYLVWPIAILLTPYRHLRGLIIGTIGIGLCWRTFIVFVPTAIGGHWPGAILPPACLESLGIGALLALIEDNDLLKQSRMKFLRGAVIVGGAIIIMQLIAYLSGRWFLYQMFGATAYLGVSLVFVWLVGMAAQGFRGRLGAFLQWPPLLYVGKISYAMYLYHNFMPGLVRYIEPVP